VSARLLLIIIFFTATNGLARQPSYYNQDAVWQKELCGNPFSAGICDSLIEADKLKRYPEIVKRSGDSLILKLANGDSLILVNFRRNGEGIQYNSFREFYPELGYYLICRRFYEGWDFILIDTETGNSTQLYAHPLFSPDFGRFVTAVADLVAGYRPNGVWIYKIAESDIILEWSFDSGSNVGFDDAVWLDTTIIALNQVVTPNDRKNSMLLKKGEKGWELLEK